LLIAYFFPPEITSAAFRAYSFFKYLPLYGWDPYVLTVAVKNKTKGPQAEIPDRGRIFHSFEIETKRHLSLFGRFPLFLAFPDNHIGWLPFAFFKSVRIIRRRKIRLIFSTSYPWTSSLVGLLLKKTLKLPWVTEFRDPWINLFLEGKKKNRIVDYLNYKLEKMVVENADGVIVTTAQSKEYYLKRFPRIDGNKITVIYNGFDADDLKPLKNIACNKEKFTICYAGLLQEGEYRDPKFFLRALSELKKERKIGKELSLIFIGCGKYVERAKFKALIDDAGLEENLQIIGSVEHNVVFDYFSAADVLLLLQQESCYNDCVPVKAFEYLALGKPIICLTSFDAETAALVKKYSPQSLVIDYRDNREIKKGIMEFYAKWQDNVLVAHVDPEFMRLFARKRQTSELAEAFGSVLFRKAAGFN